MKTIILAALAVIGLSTGAANAQSVSHTATVHQPAGNQYNWLGGGD
jgi:hypothetical protein